MKSMRVVGVSYGGFVAYSMATQFKERVERVVLCCAGICMEEKDMDEGMFKTKSVDEAISILLPQSPEKMKELMQLTFVKPSFNVKTVPTCILNDFINVSGSSISLINHVLFQIFSLLIIRLLGFIRIGQLGVLIFGT